uniref:Uncharacterized protein n=1 Tax=Oryza nivara TaxID=4536 RepID=A0A0E0HNX8_ORYNI
MCSLKTCNMEVETRVWDSFHSDLETLHTTAVAVLRPRRCRRAASLTLPCIVLPPKAAAPP